MADVLLAAEPGSRIVGEELSPELVDGRAGVDRRPARRHDQLSARFSGAMRCRSRRAVDGVLEAGVVVQVPRQRAVTRRLRGGGAWQGERRLSVLSHRRPGIRADRHRLPVQGHVATERVSGASSPASRRGRAASGGPGAAALDLADVAAGRFDGFWEQQLSAWDIAAGMLLVREAGGMVTDFEGRHVGRGAHRSCAGNPTMHAWLLEMLAS